MTRNPTTIPKHSDTVQATIEADWQLNDLCNMECKYCFTTTTRDRSNQQRLDPVRCLDFFNATKEVWSLHLTGGEPFLYPGFVELCSVLTRGHLISLNSNLASAQVPHFADTVDPSRVEYVHCCLHLQERERRNAVKQFEENLCALMSRGFQVAVSQVMTSEIFCQFPLAAKRFSDLGVALIPKSLQGLFQGKWYPHAYTEEEKYLFRLYSEQAEASLSALAPQLQERGFTVNALWDREFLNGFPVFRGVDCAAGARFFTIRSNGDIFRCGTNHHLGNIASGVFNPLPRATPCDSSYYPYFCLRHSQMLQSAPQTSIPLQVPPPACMHTVYDLFRRGRRVLKHSFS